MEQLVIEKTIELKASPERVWRAITSAEELAQWFPDEAEMELTEGGAGSLTWKDHGTFDIQIVEVDPPKRFVWRWPDGTRPLSEFSTLVEFNLERRADGGTILNLRESGFDKEEKYRDNQGGWDHELGELVKYLD